MTINSSSGFIRIGRGYFFAEWFGSSKALVR